MGATKEIELQTTRERYKLLMSRTQMSLFRPKRDEKNESESKDELIMLQARYLEQRRRTNVNN